MSEWMAMCEKGKGMNLKEEKMNKSMNDNKWNWGTEWKLIN